MLSSSLIRKVTQESFILSGFMPGYITDVYASIYRQNKDVDIKTRLICTAGLKIKPNRHGPHWM